MGSRTVGELARLARVSVRTLHHYDEIGLLSPSMRTCAGYRLYTDADLQRLLQIRFYRELEFGLEEIAAILGDPQAGAEDHLRRQHALLRRRIEHDTELLAAIEKEMEARQMGIALTPEEQFEIFGTDQVGGEWAEEAEQRWGESAAWAESQRRTAAYSKDDWVTIKAEADANLAGFAAALGARLPADGTEARLLAEEHRQHICRWFYDCGYALHRGLAEMYIADPRFTQTYENVATGLARYVHDAIVANAAAGGQPG